MGDASSIPGLGRSPGEGNGNLLQYSCQGIPMDRGAWQATAHGGHNKSDMTKPAHTHAHSIKKDRKRGWGWHQTDPNTTLVKIFIPGACWLCSSLIKWDLGKICLYPNTPFAFIKETLQVH